MELFIENRDNKKLFVRKTGTKVPLVLIHGAMVDADFFQEASKYLAHFYTVISYDRRGYSRSDAETEYALEKQAEDLSDILHCLGVDRAIIVGCSAGGVIAMKFMEMFPDKVLHLFLHEPPLVSLENVLTLEERNWLEEINDLRKKGKIRKGVVKFVVGLSREPDPRAISYSPEQIDRQMKNGLIFIGEEFQDQFCGSNVLDLEKLKIHSKDISCLIGDSSGDTYAVRSTIQLAKTLNNKFYYCPGSHNSAHDLPIEFSAFIHGFISINCR